MVETLLEKEVFQFENAILMDYSNFTDVIWALGILKMKRIHIHIYCIDISKTPRVTDYTQYNVKLYLACLLFLRLFIAVIVCQKLIQNKKRDPYANVINVYV